MQEMAFPPDAGFVVEWQLVDDSSTLIDLSTAERDVVLPEHATSESSAGITA